jgi:hypothetical protein
MKRIKITGARDNTEASVKAIADDAVSIGELKFGLQAFM